MKNNPSASFLEELAKIDTPTICNAIEILQYRLRNEGYLDSRFPLRTFPVCSMVGYAVTLQMRTAHPPIKGQSYKDRDDWWESVLSIPEPRVLVIQDLDNPPGTGSVAGGIHAEIFKALGGIGIVTNGAVRDLETLNKGGMHVYSGSVCPSHAYAHIIEIGQPAVFSDLIINPGDLVHADRNGMTTIPKNLAEKIMLQAKSVLHHEEAIFQLCNSKAFSLPALKDLLTKME